MSNHSEMKKEFHAVVSQKDALHKTSQSLREDLEEAREVLHQASGDIEVERKALQDKLQSLTDEHGQLQITYNETVATLTGMIYIY